MKITYSEIINYFNEKGIKYKVIGNPKDEYIVASLFSAIDSGFYFIEDNKSINNITNSLFLTNSISNLSKSNVSIIVKESPQLVFYQLLDYYFKEISSGKICKTTQIHKDAQIGKNVQIDSFVVLGKCEIGDNSIVKSNAVINDNVIIGKNTIIEPGCVIGATGIAWVWNEIGERIRQPQLGGVMIEDNCIIGAQSVLVRGSLNENTYIGKDSVIAPGARIGHGTKIGEKVHLANNVVMAGNAKIGDRTFLGSGSIISSNVRLQKNTIVGAGSMVNKNFEEENLTLVGNPAKVLYTNNLKYKSKGVPIPFKKSNYE